MNFWTIHNGNGVKFSGEIKLNPINYFLRDDVSPNMLASSGTKNYKKIKIASRDDLFVFSKKKRKKKKTSSRRK